MDGLDDSDDDERREDAVGAKHEASGSDDDEDEDDDEEEEDLGPGGIDLRRPADEDEEGDEDDEDDDAGYSSKRSRHGHKSAPGVGGKRASKRARPESTIGNLIHMEAESSDEGALRSHLVAPRRA